MKKQKEKNPPPASLLAVVRKALALDAAARYPRTEDLQADVLAYQNGFATSAEKAGAWKQAALFVKRHKAASIAAALVLVLSAGFSVKAVADSRRTARALDELRSTAPTFIAQAESQITAHDLAHALENATAATKLAPNFPEYHVFRAHILFAIPDLRAAADEYRTVLRLRDDPEAREHLALCNTLLRSEPDPAKLSAGALNSIYSLTVKYGRTSHAVYLLRELHGERKQLLDAWAKVLVTHGIIPFRGDYLTLLDDGTFKLGVLDQVSDLTPLRGMPLSDLIISATKVVDLRPLAGMTSLRGLNLQGTKVADLTPLKGLPLKTLNAMNTEISSLEPLAGMPLRKLSLYLSRRVKDLTPLRGMKLEELDTRDTSIENIEVLRGMPLRKLSLNGEVKDISALHDLPLEELSLGMAQKINDFSPLRGMRLKRLNLSGTYISDLNVLAGMPLGGLNLLSCGTIDSLEPIRGAHLKWINICNTHIADLSPLRDMPLEFIDATNSLLRDLRPLANLPLKRVDLILSAGPVDLAPLAQCASLESLTLPKTYTNLETLRHHPALSRLSARNDDDKPAQTTAEFWKEYDALKAAGPK